MAQKDSFPAEIKRFPHPQLYPCIPTLIQSLSWQIRVAFTRTQRATKGVSAFPHQLSVSWRVVSDSDGTNICVPSEKFCVDLQKRVLF